MDWTPSRRNVVGHLEGVLRRDLLLADDVQPLVGDEQQRVDVLLEPLDTLFRRLLPPDALKPERRRDNADRQSTGLADDLRDDGGSACAGPTTHASGDEDHVCVAGDLVDLFPALLGGPGAQVGVSAHALALGKLLADGEPHGNVGPE